MIVLPLFFHLLLLQTSIQLYFILKVLKAVDMGQLSRDINTWNHLTVCKQMNNVE